MNEEIEVESQPYPPLYIEGGYRCALRKSEYLPNWYVGTSPRNGDNAAVEGGWDDWVALAKNILAADEEMRKTE